MKQRLGISNRNSLSIRGGTSRLLNDFLKKTMTQIQEIIQGPKWLFPVLTTISVTQTYYFWSGAFPQLSSVRLGDGNHHFEFLIPFPAWGTGNVSLYLPHDPVALTLETKLLSVCWKHIPFLINFTINFTESLCLASVLLLLDTRTKVNFQDHFSTNTK
jgi:hypothetical protein